MGALLLVGCSSPKNDTQQKPKPKPQTPLTLNTGPGTAYIRGSNRELQWSVRWSSTVTHGTGMDSGPVEFETGFMKDVAGTLYDKNGKATVTFHADNGVADKDNNVLRLHGNVVVTSIQHRETLTTDALAYDARAKLLHATGNVQFKGNVGTMGTFSELSATSDFSRVGTPDLFDTP